MSHIAKYVVGWIEIEMMDRARMDATDSSYKQQKDQSQIETFNVLYFFHEKYCREGLLLEFLILIPLYCFCLYVGFVYPGAILSIVLPAILTLGFAFHLILIFGKCFFQITDKYVFWYSAYQNPFKLYCLELNEIKNITIKNMPFAKALIIKTVKNKKFMLYRLPNQGLILQLLNEVI